MKKAPVSILLFSVCMLFMMLGFAVQTSFVVSHQASLKEVSGSILEMSLALNEIQTNQKVTVTAYNPVEAQTNSDPNNTACMYKSQQGLIAVSRDLRDRGWTCGKKVYISGIGIYTIGDLLHKRKKNQLDILMYSKKKALQFGVKKKVMAVLFTANEKHG